MSPVKIVLIILLVLGLLYGLSVALGSGADSKKKTPPSEDTKTLSSVPSADWLKSLSDRFSPGFEFKTVRDPHAFTKTRSFNVLHGQAAKVLISSSTNVQRMKFTQILGDCTILYSDNNSDAKPDQPEGRPSLDKTIAITKQGGSLTIKCSATSQDCVLKVK